MHVTARARRFLARRPWVYWLIVAAIAAGIAVFFHTRLAAVEQSRAAWGRTQRVLVADGALEPGGPIDVTSVERPVAMLPTGALTELAPDARLRQSVAAGEVLVDLDVATRPGPASMAEPGTAVVGLTDPLSRGVTIGLEVQVAADGVVLAEHGTVVEVVDDVVFVAVPRRDVAMVAAAAQSGRASLVYLP